MRIIHCVKIQCYSKGRRVTLLSVTSFYVIMREKVELVSSFCMVHLCDNAAKSEDERGSLAASSPVSTYMIMLHRQKMREEA